MLSTMYTTFVVDSWRQMRAFFITVVTYFFVGGVFFLLCAPAIAGAQVATPPCGNIIFPADAYSAEQITPIVNCSDPFSVTTSTSSPYTLHIEGNVVHNGDVIAVPEGGTNTFEVTGRSIIASPGNRFFLHEGNNYRFINLDPLVITEADYRALAVRFFPTGTDIEPYITNILNGGHSFNDSAMDTLRVGFFNFVNQNFVPKVPKLRAGTYTLLSQEQLFIVTQNTLLQKFLETVVPVAHAQSFENVSDYTFTLTFTITEAPPKPTGASSVLFLPGIQASRLYKHRIFGLEDQLWPPNEPNDVSQLAMTPDGVSVNTVYTRDVIDSSFGIGSVYGGFLNFLESQKTAQIPIKDFTAFAYDWRYDVFAVAEQGTQYESETKSLISAVENLAANSYTGKVTIVAHSNGGLVAKALLSELDRRHLASKVDRVIFVGTPQLGTPKAIGTILHGYDQSDGIGGVILNPLGVREVINNMPGAYGLLPSEKFIEGTTEPVITFDNSSTTAPYRLAYGTAISSFANYKKFLLGSTQSGRTLTGPVSTPAKANQTMLDRAFGEHTNKLDTWIAPTGVEVVEIVGTGLPTLKGIEYREISEANSLACTAGGGAIFACTPKKILKPYAQLTKYGDQTVVQRSAEAYGGEKRKFFVNLSQIKKDFPQSKFEHFNLTEIPQIQKLVSTIVDATSTANIQFISNNYSTFDDAYDIEVINSPVRMLATDLAGHKTGIVVEGGANAIKKEIPGSQYFEFGDTKYLLIPKGINHTTTLYGEGFGTYTLTQAQLGATDAQSITHNFQNASVTPRMVAVYSKTGDVFSTVKTDFNGDGITDLETSIDGVLVRYTYTDLRLAVTDLHLPRLQDNVLREIITLAEQAGKLKVKYPLSKQIEKLLLKQVSTLMQVYKQKSLVTSAQVQQIERIIVSIVSN